MKLNEALSIKTENRIAAMDEAERRRSELHLRLPRVKAIDDMLREIPMRALVGESVESLRAESESLSAERHPQIIFKRSTPSRDAPHFYTSWIRLWASMAISGSSSYRIIRSPFFRARVFSLTGM